jgi:hypothetical protein
MKPKFIILLGANSMITPTLFSDLIPENNVIISHIPANNSFIYRAVQSIKRRLHISVHKQNKLLENRHFSKTHQYFVIIADYATSSVHFDKLKKQNNVKYVLLFFNPLSRPLALKASQYAGFFDLIVTIDPEDAKQKGWMYYPQIYSKTLGSLQQYSKTNAANPPKAYFIGYDKKRGQFLYNISKRLEEIGVEFTFKVLRGSVVDSNYDTFSYLSSPIPYEQVLADLAQADCIIDVLQPGQTGASIRYAEAVCYNKILITDNKAIRDLPYFTEKYMHIIEDANQIKREWFSCANEIDYHYKNDFSPRCFLDMISDFFSDSSRSEK